MKQNNVVFIWFVAKFFVCDKYIDYIFHKKRGLFLNFSGNYFLLTIIIKYLSYFNNVVYLYMKLRHVEERQTLKNINFFLLFFLFLQRSLFLRTLTLLFLLESVSTKLINITKLVYSISSEKQF